MTDDRYHTYFDVGETVEWDELTPEDVLPIAENDDEVLLKLTDTAPSMTVHANKDALRAVEWESAEQLREAVGRSSE